MHHVKKLLTACLSVVMTLTLSVPAMAATENGTKSANALYMLGLVKGVSAEKFDPALDNGLTRAESIALICRFLGTEREALAGDWATPFQDVPTWAAPYINWAYHNGITAGTGVNRFEPDIAIPQNQFLTLMLRAMGYEETADSFRWDAPYDIAKRIGLLNVQSAVSQQLSRDMAMQICWNALSAATKDQSRTLADSLIANGIILSEKYESAKSYMQTGTIPDGSSTGNTGNTGSTSQTYTLVSSISGPDKNGVATTVNGQTIPDLSGTSRINNAMLVAFDYNELQSIFGNNVTAAVLDVYSATSSAWGNHVTGDKALWDALIDNDRVQVLGMGNYHLSLSEQSSTFTLQISIMQN